MPKGTESDVEESSGLLGSDVHQLSALFSANLTAKLEPERDEPDPNEGVATSGILDIRALADAYESEFARMADAEADEEPPMVSQTGLGLLIPQAEPEKEAQRTPYLLLAMVAVLLVVGTAAATAFVVKRGTPAAAAAVPTAEQCAQLAQAPAATAPGAMPQAAQPQAVVPGVIPAPADEPKIVTETEDKPEVAATESREDEPKAEETEEEREARRARREERRLAREREAAEKAEAEKIAKAETVVDEPEPAPSPEPAAEEKKEEKAAGGDKCDEVACLVDPNGPCCAKRSGKTPTAEKTAEASNLPERLSASDVNAGLRPIKGRIDSCGDRNGFSGTAKLKLTIAPSGKVQSVTVAEGNAAFQSCVVGHVKKATFEKTQKGMSLTYPIVLR